jgi:hypothetical protein
LPFSLVQAVSFSPQQEGPFPARQEGRGCFVTFGRNICQL